MCHGTVSFRASGQHRMTEAQPHPTSPALHRARFSPFHTANTPGENTECREVLPASSQLPNPIESGEQVQQQMAPAHPQLGELGGVHRPFLSAALTLAPSCSSRFRHGNRSGSSLARSRGLLSWICTTGKNS